MDDYALVAGLLAVGASFGALLVYAVMADRGLIIEVQEPPFPVGAMPGLDSEARDQ